MNTNFVSPDAATGTTTAFNELKINRTMNVARPTFSNGECDFIRGKTFFINKYSAIYVQDVCEQQNSTLFEQGIKLIDSKVTPKRRSYLIKMLTLILPTSDMSMDDMAARSRDVLPIIAFVCDMALHKNKKLAHPVAYDKDFNKYVANLFYQYKLDGAFERYVHLGEKAVPVPEFLVSPEMYNNAV